MHQPRMYRDLAKWWPLLSPVEDYAEETEVLRSVFDEKLGAGRHTLLDLGVGGGHHLSHLTARFDAVAVDISPEMLENSRRLNPSVEHHVADMRQVRLRRSFDAVLVHDAVDYLLSREDIEQMLATVVAHLRVGGVLVLCPDWFKETFVDQSVCHTTHFRDETSLTYIEYVHDPDPSDTTIESIMFFLIRERGEVRIEQDRHVMGLFPRSQWIDLVRRAGFAVQTRSNGSSIHGQALTLIVGVKN